MAKRNRSQRVSGALLGLGAATLFGLSAPFSKWLMGQINPVLLAGLLYLGAAIGLWLYRIARPATAEAPLTPADKPSLIGVVLLGGVLAPVLMLLGLQRVTALAGSLLLNLEAPFTVVVIAVAFFREHVGRYAGAAGLCILVGALVLKMEPGAVGADTLGVLLLASACLCWGIDNNLTQRLSLRDPFAIVRVKALVAGVVNSSLGLVVMHGRLPDMAYVVAALVLGSLSYGVSIVLDAYALRLVGAAREAAYFATAPFVGALVSIAVFGNTVRWFDILALSSMALGVLLLLRERHAHVHQHEEMEHEHLHRHDEHHQHAHGDGDPPGEPHSHFHRHVALTHDHPHLPDLHHRHEH